VIYITSTHTTHFSLQAEKKERKIPSILSYSIPRRESGCHLFKALYADLSFYAIVLRALYPPGSQSMPSSAIRWLSLPDLGPSIPRRHGCSQPPYAKVERGRRIRRDRISTATADRRPLLTVGVVVARNVKGELFGFECAAELVHQSRTANEIAADAQRFGQQDDITVVTVIRMQKIGL
jgi:hypothetical protein